MKLVYVCFWDAYRRDGVSTKINLHTTSWREQGHEVEVYCLSPAGAPGAPQALDARVFAFTGYRERILATRRMLRAASRSSADAAYLRFDHFLPTTGRLVRSKPTVIEVNGSEAFFRSWNKWPNRLYSHFNEHVACRAARGFVAVSHREGAVLQRWGKPVEVVGNGVDLDARKPAPAPRSERIRFALMVGARAAWYGVDKVIRMAAAMPDCDFTLIGVDSKYLDTTPTDNVAVHGLLPKEEYEPLLAEADLALGALAMDRVDRHEFSSLKVPEYLAYGLPVILGYEETDFMGKDPWYLLRLPTTASNVDDHVAEIRAFAQRVKGRRVRHDEIAGLVGAQQKEERRLRFIEDVTRG